MARIGIDARIFGAERGGIGRYTEELIFALPQDMHGTLVLFMRGRDMSRVRVKGIRAELVRADVREYGAKEQWRFPRIIHDARLDLLHVPHINIPYLYRGPLVVTIHDLVEYKYDRSDATTLPRALYRAKRAILRAGLARVLNRADAIIAVSQWGKRDITKTLPSLSSPLHVIPHGAPRSSAGEAQYAPFPYRYILYIGNAAPHKNVPRLIAAYKQAAERDAIPHHLVLVMPADTATARVQSMIAALPLRIRERIHRFSALSEKDLASYICHASLLCSASREEGYGLPFVEALVRGIPVLGSFVGILPELAGPYAHYWDPRHVESMRKVLVTALYNPLILPRNPPLPSWEDVAEQHMALYTSVANKRQEGGGTIKGNVA